MNDKQFEDSMIRAGIRKRYHNSSLRLTSYVEEHAAIYQFMCNKSSVLHYFTEMHQHMVLVDESGNGQHAANMIARGLLYYGIPVQVLNIAKISQVLDSGYSAQALNLNNIVTDARVIVLLGAATSNGDYDNFSKIEWFVREMISDNKSIIFQAEEPMNSEANFLWQKWSTSFCRMRSSGQRLGVTHPKRVPISLA